MSMSRTQLERKYEQFGLKNYQLTTLEDLQNVHNIDVTTITGYANLPEEQKQLFNEAVLNFYNVFGLDNRAALVPKAINYVCEVEYVKDGYSVGIQIFLIDKNHKVTSKRLHKYVFDKKIDLSDCKQYKKVYLRFELKDVWYHILNSTSWY